MKLPHQSQVSLWIGSDRKMSAWCCLVPMASKDQRPAFVTEGKDWFSSYDSCYLMRSLITFVLVTFSEVLNTAVIHKKYKAQIISSIWALQEDAVSPRSIEEVSTDGCVLISAVCSVFLCSNY